LLGDGELRVAPLICGNVIGGAADRMTARNPKARP